MIKKAEFVMSNTDVKKCPPPDKPEYAFIGRSNVGKSSLINMLTGQNSLAKVSSTPGKTQVINHYLIDESWYLVDLPGYGYARRSASLKAGFEQMISGYITRRENLYCVFVLIDVRHSPQKIDVEFINWLGEKQVPFSIIFTKADKLGKNAVKDKVDAYSAELLNHWEQLPSMFVSSSFDGSGRDEIISFIRNVNHSA